MAIRRAAYVRMRAIVGRERAIVARFDRIRASEAREGRSSSNTKRVGRDKKKTKGTIKHGMMTIDDSSSTSANFHTDTNWDYDLTEEDVQMYVYWQKCGIRGQYRYNIIVVFNVEWCIRGARFIMCTFLSL